MSTSTLFEKPDTAAQFTKPRKAILESPRTSAPVPAPRPAVVSPEVSSEIAPRHPAMESCLEIVTVILLAIMVPTGLLVFLVTPGLAVFPMLVFTPVFLLYLGADALRRWAAGER